MFLSKLRAISKSPDNKIKEPSVRELTAGVRETYLKKAEYAVDSFSVLYSLQGQAIHSMGDGILGDLKVTNSYELMKALGIYKVDVETGEFYKTGLKKGPSKKTRITLRRN